MTWVEEACTLAASEQEASATLFGGHGNGGPRQPVLAPGQSKVSSRPAETYCFAGKCPTGGDDNGLSKEALRATMDRLLKTGEIKIETFWPPSLERKRLTLAESCADA